MTTAGEINKTNLSLANVLAKRVSQLPGIGEKTAELLAKNHIYSLFDLLLHVPKSVVMQSESPGFLHMESGRTYVVKGKVVAQKVTGAGSKKRLEAILQDETGRLSVIFFGPAVNYAQAILKVDKEVVLSGEAKDFLGRMQMVHPKLITNSAEPKEKNIANYSQLGGLSSALYKRIVDKALVLLKREGLNEHLTANFIKSHRMTSIYDALSHIHEPKDQNEMAWDQRGNNLYYRRLAFEELLSFYLRLNLERQKDKKKPARAIPACSVDTLVTDCLPFSLTLAQKRVIAEIIADMTKPVAMTRLMQGDVGSGKTAVSALIARHIANHGLQIALMAPTEILAEQLYHVYSSFFSKLSVEIALLTANTKAKERKLLTERIALNQMQIVIGTHALLSEDIRFSQLGLVIVDEQHRFGVKQRALLLDNCHNAQGFSPHLLVMSATPIPRSLALTFYGDLDLSIIDERPPGRLPVHTQVLSGPVLDLVARLGERIIATKQKAFIVFPLVEESENLDLENATKAKLMLCEKFGDHSSMLLHGKMKPDEKTKVMTDFRDGRFTFLVATTVVEVGVDVPDATCMVIAHPERFGLAQLHQLRGRVGRKDLKSYCFLITDLTNKFGAGFKRLNAMCQTDNGFKLAEIDLQIRGPGELLGIKQSGLPNFLIFNYSDFADLVGPAKDYAKSIIEQGLNPSHAHLYVHKISHFS